VVPVGLTQFSHLYAGRRMDRETARELLAHVERWSARALAERGTTWVYAADELYLLAERELPGVDHYGEFAQIENGIGAITWLRHRVLGSVGELPRLDGRIIGVVTGTSMAPMMAPLLAELTSATGARFELIVVENSLFGPTTTVAGLLPGADIRRALDGRTDLDFALIPAESINESGLFLDDASFADVRASLPIPVHPSYDFIDVLSDDAVIAMAPAA
jgi:NifB/MoaA-like Fe-S oxidoreductase